MDLYRYFHPHHNPRLKGVPLRLQELAELEQAATELKRALERAEVRTTDHPVGGIQGEHLHELVIAMQYVVESLRTLTKAHPGDTGETMRELLRERVDAPGWENWSRLLEQRLIVERQYEPLSSVAHGPEVARRGSESAHGATSGERAQKIS